MNSRRKYICSKCGSEIWLFADEINDYSNVLCENCQKKDMSITDKISNSFSTKESNTSGVLGRVIGALADGVAGIAKELDVPIVSSVAKAGKNIVDIVTNESISRSSMSSVQNDDWICIGNLNDAYKNGKLRLYSKYVGLYMHKIENEIMYIGRAIEYNNGGFRKRLSDYCRDSDSARKHPSGQMIYKHRDEITTYLLIVGSDEEAKQKTIQLEKEYIGRYNPPWNDKLKQDW